MFMNVSSPINPFANSDHLGSYITLDLNQPAALDPADVPKSHASYLVGDKVEWFAHWRHESIPDWTGRANNWKSVS